MLEQTVPGGDHGDRCDFGKDGDNGDNGDNDDNDDNGDNDGDGKSYCVMKCIQVSKSKDVRIVYAVCAILKRHN